MSVVFLFESCISGFCLYNTCQIHTLSSEDQLMLCGGAFVP